MVINLKWPELEGPQARPLPALALPPGDLGQYLVPPILEAVAVRAHRPVRPAVPDRLAGLGAYRRDGVEVRPGALLDPPVVVNLLRPVELVPELLGVDGIPVRVRDRVSCRSRASINGLPPQRRPFPSDRAGHPPGRTGHRGHAASRGRGEQGRRGRGQRGGLRVRESKLTRRRALPSTPRGPCMSPYMI